MPILFVLTLPVLHTTRTAICEVSNIFLRAPFYILMNWDNYKKIFSKKAGEQGYTEEDLAASLRYARRLADRSLPIIYNQKHLSLLVGYKISYLRRVAHSPDKFYRHYNIKKKNGNIRTISEPLPSLKEIQKWILDEILYKIPISAFAKGFCPGRSIKDNARFHVRQKSVMAVDIQNFFPTIHFVKIYRVFRIAGYSKGVCVLLSKLCSLSDGLPQGAPTSPALSNLIARHLDRRLGGLALKLGLRYTRYADDLTFSGNELSEGSLISTIRKILVTEGFALNESKTRVMHQHQRQEVTGIVVNQGMSAPKELKRELRQVFYYISEFGISSHCEKIKWPDHHDAYVCHILGRANFARFITPRDEVCVQLYENLKNLLLPDR